MGNDKTLEKIIKFFEIYGFKLNFQDFLILCEVPHLVGVSPLHIISELDALSSIYLHLQIFLLRYR